MTKHRTRESSYRLQIVKNQAVDNKVVFLFKRKTTLVTVVVDKLGRFVIEDSLYSVCEPLIDK